MQIVQSYRPDSSELCFLSLQPVGFLKALSTNQHRNNEVIALVIFFVISVKSGNRFSYSAELKVGGKPCQGRAGEAVLVVLQI